MHRDLRIGRVDCPIRLLTRPAEGVRHRRAFVRLDLGRMAELAAAVSGLLAYYLLRHDLRIGAYGCTVAGLSASRRNNSHENAQNNKQPPRTTFCFHGSAGIQGLRQVELYL